MPVEFLAVGEPSDDLLGQISALAPENPFYTSSYVKSVSTRHASPFALLLESEGVVTAACTAFLKTGRLNRRLEITSLPVLPQGTEFWDGLVKFCRESDISVLNVETFGSPETVIPPIAGETLRTSRYEYQLDLTEMDLWSGLNRRNRRGVKKAIEAGLDLRGVNGTESCRTHVDIANSSLRRRRRRGENIEYEILEADAIAFIENGAGDIYQVFLGDEILSSMLLLKSASGAYAQTSGTRDAGLEYGASQFLWYETAKLLQNESIRVLNMGGTDIDSRGLQEFKAGFGAKRFELESAEFYLGGSIRKAIGSFIERLRQ